MRPIAAGFLFAVIVAAQQPATTHHTVTASGEATIPAKPDRVQISLGVETNASTAQATAAQNAAKATKLLGAIRRVLGKSGSIATSQYALAPVYRNKQGEAPELTGYRTNNTVVVKTSDLALVPKILDTATQAGANRVAGISFTLHNDGAIRARALTQAAQRARANAEAIANGLHLHVVRVLRATTSGSAHIQPMVRLFRAGLAASTPIEPATVQVSATVTVTLEVQ
ncbi:MAG: SIMPL domain-containing protein [Bryobacteraceae bacterium]